MTGGPITKAIQDGAVVGSAFKRAGSVLVIVILAFALLVSAVSNIVIQRNAIKLASEVAPTFADRWTATDMDNYKIEHAKEVAEIVKQEKATQAEINKELLEAVHGIQEQIAGDAVRWENLRRQLDRIEERVFDGHKGGG